MVSNIPFDMNNIKNIINVQECEPEKEDDLGIPNDCSHKITILTNNDEQNTLILPA